MNTEEILNCLQQDPYARLSFEGVFPRDQLPKRKSLPMSIVANTDTRKGPGQHWVAMYFPNYGDPIYFDSYGLPPQNHEFADFIGFPQPYNTMQLQSPFSSTCGQHSIFFLAMTTRGYSLKQIQEAFDPKNKEDNDAMVTDFVNKKYNMNTAVYDQEFLSKQICIAMKDVKINGKHVCPIH